MWSSERKANLLYRSTKLSSGAGKRKRESDGANDEVGFPDPYSVVSTDGANDEIGIPDPHSVVSPDGAQWLRKYMRRLEEKYKNDDTDYTSSLVSVDESAKYWDPLYRNEQDKRLNHQYTDFMESLVMNADTSEHTELATIKSYTQSSGNFNRYLASDKHFREITKLRVHRLYKLLARCPRLEQQTMFLRSVTESRRLPHVRLSRPGGKDPVIGRAYLNVTFLSTTTKRPEAFFDAPLFEFFDEEKMCCMYVITAPAGLPILPLMVGDSDYSEEPAEAEVLLPPGILLVYQGERVLTVRVKALEARLLGKDGEFVDKSVRVHFYQAVVPPRLDPLVET